MPIGAVAKPLVPNVLSGVPVNKCKRFLDFPKSTSFYGQCKGIGFYNRMSASYDSYQIRLSVYLLDSDNEILVKNTILHELCHTCDGCMNHGTKWKTWIRLINTRLGYKISEYPYSCERSGDESDFSLVGAQSRCLADKVVKVKHELYCTKCGRVYKRTRDSRLTSHPENYRCSCGGTLQLKY
jgi:predicted SprT family Zn-dependent metalloprotease